MKSSFSAFQQLGRALMLPIAVLPIAGLLLRLGQADLLDISVIAQAGDAVFSNLPLLFAVGVAIGFAKDNHGAAALAGAVGFLILGAILKVMPDTLNSIGWSSLVQMDTSKTPATPKPINMGVLGGIISGVVAGLLYNRYKDTVLPPYLAFFGGRRLVPIVVGLVMVVLGVVLGVVWPPIQNVLDVLGHWLIGAGSIGLFIYGALNRFLLVTGLHHVLNSFVWFVFGQFPDPSIAGKIATGDLHRFFAGDPSAGAFMTGFFPIMMFGLPAACLAMYRNALPHKKNAAGGILLSAALTSFLTGVTEPIEFAFMFLAPVLYAIHAVLTGLSLVFMDLLHVRLGFTFSAGLFDYLLSGSKGSNPLLLIPFGLFYAGLYYFIFNFFIKKYNLPTIGREPDVAPLPSPSAGTPAPEKGLTSDLKTNTPNNAQTQKALAYIQALGGAANIKENTACTTRLRLELLDLTKVDEPAMRALGAKGFVKSTGNAYQVVIGPDVELLLDDMRKILKS